MKNKDLLIYTFVESFEFKNIVIGIGIEKRDSWYCELNTYNPC